MLKYKFALEMLETEIKILIEEFEFKNKYNPVEHIKSRIKSKESAIKKLKNKNYDITLENLKKHVHDMVGVRIVCSFLSDVIDIVKLIENSKQIKIKEKKDYITTPKDTGYSSYHLIVFVPIYLNGKEELIEAEIQIRTVAMDFWASLDHKIQYKFPKEIPEEIKQDLYNCSLSIKALDKRMLILNEIVNKYKKD
ncbi:MAG: GTP pyrophosphokinase family protein [Firmicutes bacterium]|nr:GTP pyrophosphokinase family protein [Bacillota bacterium]